jgi:hypothetical protein
VYATNLGKGVVRVKITTRIFSKDLATCLEARSMDDQVSTSKVKGKTSIEYAKSWGGMSSFQSPSGIITVVITSSMKEPLTLVIESSLPPSVLATLVFAQHARPFQPMPMIFPPLLLFSTYLNLQGYKIDSAGTTGALSGLYLVMAGRRRVPLFRKFGVRGIIRGGTMALCLANVIGGGLAYTYGSRSKDDRNNA